MFKPIDKQGLRCYGKVRLSSSQNRRADCTPVLPCVSVDRCLFRPDLFPVLLSQQHIEEIALGDHPHDAAIVKHRQAADPLIP
jgi:hypothetical protein